MRRVVCDTGPLLHLQEADVLSVLEPLGGISLPPAVHADWQNAKLRWLEITELDARSAEMADGWLQAGLLDRGEAHALALAAQVKADWVLTDDAAARVIAAMGEAKTALQQIFATPL